MRATFGRDASTGQETSIPCESWLLSTSPNWQRVSCGGHSSLVVAGGHEHSGVRVWSEFVAEQDSRPHRTHKELEQVCGPLSRDGHPCIPVSGNEDKFSELQIWLL